MYSLAPLSQLKPAGAQTIFIEKLPAKCCTLDKCTSMHCPVLRQLGTLKVYNHNETIFWESDKAASFFLIKSGVVRECRMLSDGRRQISRFIFPGDLFAHTDNGNYSNTAEAVTPVSVLVIPRPQLEQSLESTPCLRRLFLKNLQQELHQTQDQVLVLGRMSAVERVSHFLTSLADITGANPLELPMTRVDIADYLGLTLETVSRVISRLKREGKIELLDTNKILLSAPLKLSANSQHVAA